MIQTSAAILIFTGIVFVLAAIVLGVRRWLMPQDVLTIRLNRERTISAPAGEKLLWALANNDIHLPAACGGRGSCGQCRVTISQGARALLPMEATHIGPADGERGVRLACMTTLRNNLTLQLPEDFIEARRWQCRVRSNSSVTPFLKELQLQILTPEPLAFDAGDYMLLNAPPVRIRYADFNIDEAYEEDWLRLRQLEVEISEPTTRAYSLAGRPGDDDVISFVVRIATPPPSAPTGTPPGAVSSYIFSLRPGDEVTLSGPFGDFHVRESQREMVFIGGGAGIAPMRAMILDQLENRCTLRKMSFWYGARSRKELCFAQQFEQLSRTHGNFSYQVALSEPAPDDDWSGYTGLIHKVVFENYLEDHPTPEEAEYYLCGPPLMSSAVVAMLEDLGVTRDSVLFDDFGG